MLIQRPPGCWFVRSLIDCTYGPQDSRFACTYANAYAECGIHYFREQCICTAISSLANIIYHAFSYSCTTADNRKNPRGPCSSADGINHLATGPTPQYHHQQQHWVYTIWLYVGHKYPGYVQNSEKRCLIERHHQKGGSKSGISHIEFSH